MWIDLNIEQKAEVMKMAVASGLRDLDAIKEMYDTSIVDNDNLHAPANSKSSLNKAMLTVRKEANKKMLKKGPKSKGMFPAVSRLDYIRNMHNPGVIAIPDAAAFYKANYVDWNNGIPHPKYSNYAVKNSGYRDAALESMLRQEGLFIDPSLSPYEALIEANMPIIVGNPYLRTDTSMGAKDASHHTKYWYSQEQRKKGKKGYSRAVDMNPAQIKDEKTGKWRAATYDDIWKSYFNHPGLMYYAAVNGYGMLDETGYTPHKKKGKNGLTNYGAAHLHFGPDRRSMNSIYHPYFEKYYDPNKYKRNYYPFAEVQGDAGNTFAGITNFAKNAVDYGINEYNYNNYDAEAEAQKLIGKAPEGYTIQYGMPEEYAKQLKEIQEMNQRTAQAEFINMMQQLMTERDAAKQQNALLNAMFGRGQQSQPDSPMDFLASAMYGNNPFEGTSNNKDKKAWMYQQLTKTPDLSWMAFGNTAAFGGNLHNRREEE